MGAIFYSKHKLIKFRAIYHKSFIKIIVNLSSALVDKEAFVITSINRYTL